MSTQASPTPAPYIGSMPELLAMLASEAAARPGRWTWRHLPREVLVALRVERGLHTLRIARKVAPIGLYEQSRWEGEMHTLLNQFGVAHWRRLDDERQGDGIAAVFQEPSRAPVQKVRS